MTSTVIFILMIGALIAAWLFVPRFMIMRAIPAVIRIFRRRNAVGADNAKAPAELGFRHKSFVESMFQMRDYKPLALQLLTQANVIKTTADGKLYLSEERLLETRWRGMK